MSVEPITTELRELLSAKPKGDPCWDAMDAIDAVHAALEAENAKLRELLAGIGQRLFRLDVDYCATCPRDDINHPCPVYTVKGGECLYKTEMRELGVEVDDAVDDA